MIGKKLQRFQDSLQARKKVVFCVKCGSTNVGQDSLHQLRCHDCGNTLEWDGLSFGIVTTDESSEATTEAVEAFRRRAATPPWIDVSDA